MRLVNLFLLTTFLSLCGCTQASLPQEQEEMPILYDPPAAEMPDYVPAQHVEMVYQYPDYPAGSEFAAATMLLNSYGYNAEIQNLLDTVNYSDDNFVFCYWGDVKTEGAIYAPGLVVCINNYLQDINAKFRSTNLTGMTWDEVVSMLNSGKPLIMWVTEDYTAPHFTDFSANNQYLYSNEHCVCVYGIDEGIVRVADPLKGFIGIDESIFQQVWTECGEMAIGLYMID